MDGVRPWRLSSEKRQHITLPALAHAFSPGGFAQTAAPVHGPHARHRPTAGARPVRPTAPGRLQTPPPGRPPGGAGGRAPPPPGGGPHPPPGGGPPGGGGGAGGARGPPPPSASL